MSPKAKNKSFPPVKVTEEFLEETKRLAEIKDEYLSDYIRKAVKMRNEAEKKAVVDEHFSTHKNNTVSREEYIIVKGGTNDISFETGEQVTTKFKPKPTMVKTFEKGRGKK